MGLELLRELELLDSLVVKGVEWIPVEGSDPVEIAGVDSSRQFDVYRGFVVFAIQGCSVLLSPTGGLIQSRDGAEAGYLDLVEASKIGVRVARDSLISSISKTLEVKLLRDVIEGSRANLALLDGSYESFLGPILVFSGELRKAAPKLAGRIRELWESRVRMLGDLARRVKLAFISKSSSKMILVEKGGVTVELESSHVKIPDFLVVRRVLRELGDLKPGFLWYPNPYVELRKGGDMVTSLAPGLSRWYTLTYVLLHPTGRVYQLTIPGKLSRDEVADIVRKLKPISPDGYPQPLAIAHHVSRLRRVEFKNLISLLTLELETGREVLEHTIS